MGSSENKEDKVMCDKKKLQKVKGGLTYHSDSTGTIVVEMYIRQYAINANIFIGLITNDEGYPEPFANVTVNTELPLPAYCGFVDVNNLPDAEKFIAENDLGEFLGIRRKYGYCEYPLYQFNEDKLRELCPEELEDYEQNLREIEEAFEREVKKHE